MHNGEGAVLDNSRRERNNDKNEDDKFFEDWDSNCERERLNDGRKRWN